MFRFRAIRRQFTDTRFMWYLFSIKDCPTNIRNDNFILLSRKETPILRVGTIVRGHPDQDLFEGDIIYDSNSKEELGIVLYDNGFYMQHGQQGKKEIPCGKHIYVRRGNEESLIRLQYIKRTPIKFQYKAIEFEFKNIVRRHGNNILVVLNKKTYRIPLDKIRACVYEDSDGNCFYEGNIYCGVFLNVDNVKAVKNI